MDPIINLDSTALRYFQVAAEFKSVRRAAEALNVSASALSRQIASLEQSLDVIPAFGRSAPVLKSWRGRDSFLTDWIDSGGRRWARRSVYGRISGRMSCVGSRRRGRMPRRRDGCWRWRRFATG